MTRFPNNLLTTATHDHKRGEDTRARLAVISERSVWYTEKVQQWRTLAAPLRQLLEDGLAPSPGDELMLYQTLLGSWPLGLDSQDESGLQHYLDRMLRWQEKALREAKLRTTWSAPNGAYENACKEFLTGLLTQAEAAELRADIALAAMELAPAGALNSLTQSVLRLCTPGVPDLYQGAEFWDFSLVDPDNRQPVDFETRVTAFAQLTELPELISSWRDGRIKQWIIGRVLNLRHAHLEIFRCGDYQVLEVAGEHAERVIAFKRQFADQCLLVIAPRLTAGLLGDNQTPLIACLNWLDTHIIFPEALGNTHFRSVFTGDAVRPSENRMAIGDLLKECPVNVLYSNKNSGELYETR